MLKEDRIIEKIEELKGRGKDDELLYSTCNVSRCIGLSLTGEDGDKKDYTSTVARVFQ